MTFLEENLIREKLRAGIKPKPKDFYDVAMTPDTGQRIMTFLDQALVREKLRGLKRNDLYYVGMADTAGWWWCGKQSILENLKMEFAFFLSHLKDQIEYARTLGYVNEKYLKKSFDLHELPELSWSDIEQIFEHKRRAIGQLPPYKSLSGEEIKAEIELWGEGESEPKRKGELVECVGAERYPRMRWAFRWRDFMVEGVPDGMTKDFVYEFKFTGREGLLRYVRPIAFAQADLYGYFFRGPAKRVQIFVEDINELKTWTEPVDTKNAELTLENLWEAVRSNRAPMLPAPWKCKYCKFREECRTRWR